jgi:tRNA pseudouridine55 synthase
MTSFDVVSYLRGVLKTKKIGHAGTLDPIAAGVLPIFVGKATKAIEFVMGEDKLYRAELTLGVGTDTQDSSGRVISKSKVEASDESIAEAVRSFTGVYSQLPPMFSALKVNGKKLYEMARKGIEVERRPREVEIHSIDIIEINRNKDDVTVLFDVHCSKGTYIRTLCYDIGEKLGCGGHMSFLLRKRAGIFNIESSVVLEKI